jgi:hypothetical protein
LGLEEITAAIYDDLDTVVLSVGEKLQWAFDHFRDDYDRWVRDCLPFGLDAARRMRMIWKAALLLPPETLAQLPRAWQAMFALTRLPVDVLVEAVEVGDVHPGLTVVESCAVTRRLSGRETRTLSEADLLVGRLVRLRPKELSPEAFALINDWLNAEHGAA